MSDVFMEMTHPASPGEHATTTVDAFTRVWSKKGWTKWSPEDTADEGEALLQAERAEAEEAERLQAEIDAAESGTSHTTKRRKTEGS